MRTPTQAEEQLSHAVHEASHAVVAHVFGLTVEKVTIEPTASTHGTCDFSGPAELSELGWRRGVWAACHAGGIGQRFFAELFGLFLPVGGDHRDREMSIAAICGRPDELASLDEIEYAVRYNWPKISKVAVALCRARTLSREQFLTALARPAIATFTEHLAA